MGKKEKKPITEKQLCARIVVALRNLSRKTIVPEYINKVRFPNRSHTSYKNNVRCVECDLVFGQSEKCFKRKADLSFTKRERLKYQVDHVNGIHPLHSLADLEQFARDLFYGSLQVLCYECHLKKTRKDAK